MSVRQEARIEQLQKELKSMTIMAYTFACTTILSTGYLLYIIWRYHA